MTDNKNQLFYLRVPDNGMYSKEEDKPQGIILNLMAGSTTPSNKEFMFTEEEIINCDERLIPFAVPVPEALL